MTEKTTKSTKNEMPFLEHLEELRWRILKSLGSVVLFMVVTFPFTGAILKILTMPNDHLADPANLLFLKPTGMLTVRIEIAIAVGIVISLPVIFYQFWQFVSPGLHSSERNFVFPSIFLTTFCFLLGSAFSYFIIIPTVLPFLFGMGTETISAEININYYMSFVLRLILVAGLVFELPVISLLLSNLGILKPQFMRKYRRYGIVITFIFSAIVTPPDPMSQMLMALPLLVLYEISIFVAMYGYSRKKARDAKWDDEYGEKKD
ncbi:twin-arginine translocase subunit TatC [bacterium]|nr:twin-arginine translocase subunit TatC [bacterium]